MHIAKCFGIPLSRFVAPNAEPAQRHRLLSIHLHGFVKCSDGRLHHSVVGEKALQSWSKKQSYRTNGKAGAKKRWGSADSRANSNANGEAMAGPMAKPMAKHSKGQGEGQGEGQGDSKSLRRGKALHSREEESAPSGCDDDGEYSFDVHTGEVLS
ncbi:hypothetical protein WCLP8_1360006 [uncultured Gammaproteobacteria bacterium]